MSAQKQQRIDGFTSGFTAQPESSESMMMVKETETPPEKNILNQLIHKLSQLLNCHRYQELRYLSVKSDGSKLYVVGNLSSYYLKQILVASTRQIRNHITVEYEIVIDDHELGTF